MGAFISARTTLEESWLASTLKENDMALEVEFSSLHNVKFSSKV